ncbi:MAG: efflux RND transporter periplasmic adaptor subunit [Phycisphaerales bacterium]
MRKLRIVIIIVVALAVVGLAAGFVVKRRMAGGGEKPTIVRIEPVQRAELIEFVSAPGEIEPKRNVEISAKVSARVIALPYEEGALVTRGDPNANPPVPPSVLVQLDAKDLKSSLRSAQAARDAQAAQIEVEKARIASQKASLLGTAATLEQARTDLQRQGRLVATNDISQAEFDQAKLKVDELQAQYEAAQHSLQSAELNLKVQEHNLEGSDARIAQAQEMLSYTTITAPIDGTITRIEAEVGEMAIVGTMNNPGTVIMEVGDLSEMLVVAQVDESDVSKLRPGQKARVNIQAWPDKVFPGIVQTVALSRKIGTDGSKYYETEVLLVDPNEQVFTGMTADVDIEVATHKDILVLPSQAVLGRKVDELPVDIRDKLTEEEKKKSYASIVYCCRDGKAAAVPVKIGASNTTHTVIESGLTETDKIVVGPYKELEKMKHDQLIKDEREAKAEEEAKKKAGAKDANDPNQSK